MRLVRRRLRALEQLTGRSRATCSASAAARAGSRCTWRGAAQRDGADLDPALLEVVERRAQRGRSTPGAVSRTPAPSTSAAGSTWCSPRCSSCSFSHGAEERLAMLNAVAAHLRPGGLFAASLMDLEGEVLGDEYVPPHPTCARSTAGSTPASRLRAPGPRRHGRSSLDRVRTVVAPDGEQTTTSRGCGSSCSPRTSWRRRCARPASDAERR